MNRRPSFADRIRQIRADRHLEEEAKLTQPTLEAEAAKAADLERLDKIVDNSSEKNRNFFIAYLGLLIYVQAIIFSTSDLKLLLPNQELKLPLIDLGVPLVGFYFTIPIFIIALHFNFLQNLESHHYKLMRWQQAHPNNIVPRSRLNPFLFDFAILETNSGFRSWVLWANNILCYNLAPITLALLLFRYADRQDFPVTLWHYMAFVFDSYLVWRLRKALLANEQPEDVIGVTIVEENLPIEAQTDTTSRFGFIRFVGWLRYWIVRLWKGMLSFIVHFVEFVRDSLAYRPHGIIGLIVLLELVLSFLIAGTDNDTFKRHVLVWAKSWSRMDSRPVEWVLPRIKIEPTETVWQADEQALKIEAELAGESNWVKYFNEQGKGFRPDPTCLRLVDLYRQKMPRAQLSGLSLQGAYLSFTQMQGADLKYSVMEGANLGIAKLQGANLGGVQMQGANLGGAQMQGANLFSAQMQGANIGAEMQGAIFSYAEMQGADLSSAQMQGSDLSSAQMQGADLIRAQTQGAMLSSTSMQGALLNTKMPVYGKNSTTLFNNTGTDWGKIEKLADAIPYLYKRQKYLERIKQAQQPNEINQAQQKLHYEPKAIANSALSKICNYKQLVSAQAFRKSYINMYYDLKQNPDYPNILLDIDYQLCTLDVCKDIRDGIEGLDCQKALQNPPKW